MNEEELVENNGETLTPSELENVVVPTNEIVNDIDGAVGYNSIESVENVEEKPIRTFTQEEVDRLVGKTRIEAREKALNEMRGKYGVDSDDELDGIFGKGQTYDILDDDYKTAVNELKNVKSENALLKSGVVETRWNDVKAILGAMGLDITPENIAMQVETHPEWLGSKSVSAESVVKEKMANEGIGDMSNVPTPTPNMGGMPTPPQPQPQPQERASLQAFGNEPQGVSARPSESEEEKFARLFNL